MTTEQQQALKTPRLFRRGLEFVLEGPATALYFHTLLFCLAGRKVVTIRTFAACKGHLTCIPWQKQGPQLEISLFL
jgi:hypothetical protein